MSAKRQFQFTLATAMGFVLAAAVVASVARWNVDLAIFLGGAVAVPVSARRVKTAIWGGALGGALGSWVRLPLHVLTLSPDEPALFRDPGWFAVASFFLVVYGLVVGAIIGAVIWTIKSEFFYGGDEG